MWEAAGRWARRRLWRGGRGGGLRLAMWAVAVSGQFRHGLREITGFGCVNHGEIGHFRCQAPVIERKTQRNWPEKAKPSATELSAHPPAFPPRLRSTSLLRLRGGLRSAALVPGARGEAGQPASAAKPSAPIALCLEKTRWTCVGQDLLRAPSWCAGALAAGPSRSLPEHPALRPASLRSPPLGLRAPLRLGPFAVRGA